MAKRDQVAAAAPAPAAAPAAAAPPAPQPAADEAVMSSEHFYPDGSSVWGRPPWPELSPLQRAQQLAEQGSAEGPRVQVPEVE